MTLPFDPRAEKDAFATALSVFRARGAQNRDAEAVGALRAALLRLFESFTLRRLDEGDEPVELDLCLGGVYIEPRLRAEAIAGFEEVYAEDSDRTLARPVLRPHGVPLMASDHS